MTAEQVEETLIKSYDEGKRSVEIEGIKVTLLSYGTSLSRKKEEDEVIVYKDLFDKKPLFFTYQILSKLSKLTIIPEAETEIREVARDVFNKFCGDNHFNKGTNSKIRLGLFYKNDLIMVAGFSKPKATYKNDEKVFKAELYRAVKDYSINVENGLKKLVDFFVHQYSIVELISHVNNEFDLVEEHLKLGFEVIEEFEEHIFWLFTETNERFSSGQLLKKGLIRQEALHQMVHPPKGYLPIKDLGGKLLSLNK